MNVEWISLDFYGGYWGGSYKIKLFPEGRFTFIDVGINSCYEGKVSKRVFTNLAKKLLDKNFLSDEITIPPDFVVCDGYSRTLTWSIGGVTHQYHVKIDMGPKTVLKIMETEEKSGLQQIFGQTG
ncbi:hypothetical protein [Brevibacillus sp. H7]|uniref:hypothetical protein n=1 Tax=Brevibacillus sp. H7 TaxID=3349138 RepID=UPI003809CF3B